jgi:putative GTP pyrophosphokinase
VGGIPFDKEALEAEYAQLRPRYQKLENSLRRDLLAALQDAGVSVLTLESRVKTFDSLWAKAQRKGYTSPLDEATDLCGIRIICYYPADVTRVTQVIGHELDVVESVDKADSLLPEQFGYLSLHFLVSPKQHMLQTVSYRGLDNLVAEIQVRTLFQHAWAELSHELSYKNEEHVPKQFRRKLYQLSAILENLDGQYDELHRQKASYAEEVLKDAHEVGRFDVSQELNVDTLQAFLDFHFPERDRDGDATHHLLSTLLQYRVSLAQLQSSLNTVRDHLPAIDKAVYGTISPMKLSQYLVMRAVLELTNDDIYADSPPIAKWSRVIDYWRRQLFGADRALPVRRAPTP